MVRVFNAIRKRIRGKTMSMSLCKDCGALVDTDDEPECYSVIHEDGTEEETETCRCENCRYVGESNA